MFRPITLLFLLLTCQGALAQSTRDAAIVVTPTFPIAGLNAAEIRWEPSGVADSAALSTWTSNDGLSRRVTFFQDTPQWLTPVPANDPTIEQEILQVVAIDTVRFLTSGYVRSGLSRTGFQLPKRRVLILTDDQAAIALEQELARLQDDLAREGWDVSFSTVASNASVLDVKEQVYDFVRSPDREWVDSPLHVFLIGDIPYAMSGGYSTEGAIPNPDFHPEHGGAWASDAYYADIETSPGVDAEYQWTDDQVDLSDPAVALRAQNKNVPGDGKFDQSILPSDLELCVGRLDMRDLPTFGTDSDDRTREFELLRRYLDKNHAYRSRQFTAPMRAVIDDNFGLFARQNEERRVVEAFAASGWRSFAPIVGADSIVAGDWIRDTLSTRPTLDTLPALLAYGCGGGGYDHCDFVANVEELRRQPVNAVFTLLFGSYFADVNSTDNMMRAALANDGWILTCGWSGRPHWFLHPLANGNTIGECQRLTANNNGAYWGSTIEDLETGAFSPLLLGERNIHVMLMGDPTLTLQGPTIPGTLSLSAVPPEHEDSNAIALSWQRSPEHGAPDGSRVAYVIEAGTDRDGIYRVIDTVAPTADMTVITTVNIPDYHYRIRVRPYFTAEGRLSPQSGRGVLGSFPALSVAEHPTDNTPSPRIWWLVDVMGQTVFTRFGTFREVERVVQDSPLPSGLYLLTDRRSTAKKVTFSR